MQSTEISTELYNHDGADIFADAEQIFDCTNKNFYEEKLEIPVFSFIRNPRSKGAFLPERYASVDGRIRHGITVNSEHCQAIGDSSTMDLLAFLIVQQARRDLGPPGRKQKKRGVPGYIDRWSHKFLNSMGLQTFVEGSNEERELGYGLSVRRVEGGPFDLMCRELQISGFRFRWRENAPNVDGATDDEKGAAPEQQKQTRVRYECPECGLKALAKPAARLICGDCNISMPESPTESEASARTGSL